MAGDKLEKLAGYSYNERPQNPQRAPATHRHARDSAGRPGAGRGGMNGNKEGRASRADGRGRNGSRVQSALGLWAAGGEAGSF